jgi:hypothetical protein
MICGYIFLFPGQFLPLHPILTGQGETVLYIKSPEINLSINPADLADNQYQQVFIKQF